jgi:predicted DsbA family dithiol-disulfide isomerase
MKVEIWSDIACPWCYIGRVRFEKALAQFPHRDQVEVIWRSYELDPYAPREATHTVNEGLAKKYGVSVEEAETMVARTARVGAQEGLELRFDRVQPVRTFDAHRLLHLAAKHGVQGKLSERLHKAHFTDGENVADHETLVRLGAEVGLDADEVRQMLASDAHAGDVRADIQRGMAFGCQGVPYFVIDERYAVSGAQMPDVFLGALHRAWADSHPAVQVIGGESDAACDDAGCAI